MPTPPIKIKTKYILFPRFPVAAAVTALSQSEQIWFPLSQSGAKLKPIISRTFYALDIQQYFGVFANKISKLLEILFRNRD